MRLLSEHQKVQNSTLILQRQFSSRFSGGWPIHSFRSSYFERIYGMDAKQIKQLEPMLNKYLRQFDDCFGRIEPAEMLKAYVTGQLSDLQRKSIEPMADAAGLPP